MRIPSCLTPSLNRSRAAVEPAMIIHPSLEMSSRPGLQDRDRDMSSLPFELLLLVL
jgi:hypothetical protein